MEHGAAQADSAPAHEPEPCRVHRIALDQMAVSALSLPTEPQSWPSSFTQTEIDIARRLIRGDSRDSIAHARAVSAHTVAAQIHVMLGKLDVASASELVAELARREP